MNVNSGFERDILNHESWLVALIQVIHKYDSEADQRRSLVFSTFAQHLYISCAELLSSRGVFKFMTRLDHASGWVSAGRSLSPPSGFLNVGGSCRMSSRSYFLHTEPHHDISLCAKSGFNSVRNPHMLELLEKCEKFVRSGSWHESQPILELRMPTTSAPIMMVLFGYLHVVLPATQPTFENKHAPSLTLTV